MLLIIRDDQYFFLNKRLLVPNLKEKCRIALRKCHNLNQGIICYNANNATEKQTIIINLLLFDNSVNQNP